MLNRTAVNAFMKKKIKGIFKNAFMKKKI